VGFFIAFRKGTPKRLAAFLTAVADDTGDDLPGPAAYVKNPANAPHAGALEVGMEYLFFFGLAVLGFPGVNQATASTSFATILLFAAAGMALF